MDFLHKRRLPLEQMMPLIRERLAEGGNVRITPRGISMLPMLRQETDSVILSPVTGRLKKYDLPLYRRDDGKYILHRIVKAEEEYTCAGDNQFVFENGVRQDQVIALVTAFYRGDKLHSVEEPTYKFYCRLWHYSRPLRHFMRRGINFLRRKIKGSGRPYSQ